ncbi:hypothetical protein [Pseudonocardia sp.]|jgi:hypothetical protein|uniref:hypothetical protein n=1 Tax=Pseudonocardia sp. TaxID=60912 RepID=UPI00262BA46F|nr:hypothetical protein [Pseudonocardia sp.]MCW2722889.1 hypothetical protein [Pseudonocardia sp.]MDT7613653.1 hypothetical protein [Pseudonocardiales bacterium]
MSGAMDGTVLVQLVPTEDGGEIGWGSSRLASLTGRAEQIEGAMRGGMAVAAAALSSLPDPGDWRVESVETAIASAAPTSRPATGLRSLRERITTLETHRSAPAAFDVLTPPTRR